VRGAVAQVASAKSQMGQVSITQTRNVTTKAAFSGQFGSSSTSV